MANSKSLDYNEVIAHLVQDVHTSMPGVFTPRALRLTIDKIAKRYAREGIGFLLKTLPRLGKAFDRALSGEISFDSSGFKKMPGSQLPMLFGELFKRVFSHDAQVLPDPCIDSIKSIRQLSNLFYKLEVAYDKTLEEKVVADFVSAEDQLEESDARLQADSPTIVKARKLLARVLCNFDFRNITPRHGPGAVSTREQLADKYAFKRFIPRMSAIYPYDEYFYSSLGHVADDYQGLQSLVVEEPSARVCLVPKDSRGPRIISCEPLEIQWIQQGVMQALVMHLETHRLTRGRVNFTDQQPNRVAALQGSKTGETCTLDLKEASDRVSLRLVELLFPSDFYQMLTATRSLSTLLPDGRKLNLRKFAPMGSALCFPILALTVWSLLVAGGVDCDRNNPVLVYGDDVIVPKAKALNAIEQLEACGLLVNRTKSCINGLFRESCGMDAYNGIDVTPVRFRTVWSSRPAAGGYTSWISYANSMWRNGYRSTAQFIARGLHAIYGAIPDNLGEDSPYPGFVFWSPDNTTIRTRSNVSLQKRQSYVYVVEPVVQIREISGWSMLLRYFTEGGKANRSPSYKNNRHGMQERLALSNEVEPFRASRYTYRKRSKLRRRWR